MPTAVEGKRTKPMVDGMYTRHVDYKHGKPKLSDAEKLRRQSEQARRCASKRQTAENAQRILARGRR